MHAIDRGSNHEHWEKNEDQRHQTLDINISTSQPHSSILEHAITATVPMYTLIPRGQDNNRAFLRVQS